ncbi:putative porin [Acinetobacter sp. NIPH 2100]|uniref:putative porin n=1 Tax=Acinetobacter sp. NIPH 2100 TaxID=1217708 RepID=UPI0002D12C80|nr:putative porin [Acinetobacter sp. NIPH 2100]ENX38352.1 hypothetical protein F887_03521 [Acinetobacter sp. NIPH 2100]
MKKLAIASALLSAIAVTGTAHAYQAEVGGSYTYKDQDRFGDSDRFSVDGKYYFNPVQTRNAPLAEAAFLDRASNVKAQYAHEEDDAIKNNQYGAGIEYFVPNSDFYLSGNIGREEIKPNSKYLDNKVKINHYAGEVGYLPAPGLLVAAGAKTVDVKDGDRETSPTLRAKYVTKVGQNDVNLEAYSAFGDNKEVKLKGDYFIDKTLSVGVDYQKLKYDNTIINSNEWGISAKKFFNQQVSLEGRVGFGNDKSYVDNDYTSFGLRGAYRF